MSYRSNPLIEGVVTPPIAQAHGWVRQRAAPNGLPLLDVSQAVPSYPPAAELLTHLAELIVTDPKTGLYTDILGIRSCAAPSPPILAMTTEVRWITARWQSPPAVIRRFA